MMLFLFILMLVGVDSKESLVETIKGIRFTAITASLGIGVLLIALIGKATFGFPANGLESANSGGNVQAIAYKLFSTYVWAFEVVSALLITAALGAMVLAHSQRVTPRATQRELAIRRFRGKSLSDAAGKPAPGVFARYNGVDVPALLPDGSPAVESINDTLKARGTVRDPREYSLKEIADFSGNEGEMR
jgi:NADH-quinone oxidoreductase subunit J